MAGDGEGENSSHFLLADDDRLDVYGDRDVDASLRALRPRSSRRGSWESEASGWSARILGAGAGLSMGSKSLWTSNSVRTNGLLSVENEEKEAAEESKDEDNRNSSSNSRNNSVKVPSPNTRLAGGDVSPTKPQVTDVEKMVLDEASAPEIVAIAPPLEQREESTETTGTKVPPVSEQEQSQQSVESKQDDRQDADDESHPSTSYRSPSSSYDSGRTASDGDLHSLAATNRTETWQSALSIPAPSTPVG
ncbi:hypothetical protein SERLA73DRAFT_177255 [Serpula lacrymans var. lacrymans S7.3]|uniref:Uncharacterized protein n=2 Tax=Serpula lacrymans var. lacrymans TaxID=341189 RepID=F8PNP0_SERL3|nr:hypothetical protein SERLA73DRAFT_177255 [Serpula lacrymans var. lacrymans S7.3]